jgi:hypothetical protein
MTEPVDSPADRPVQRWKPHAASAEPRLRHGPIFLLLAAVLALTGAIAAWLSYPQPFDPPYFLGLWVDQYEDDRLPPTPWAENDRSALTARWPRSNHAFTSQSASLLRGELDNLTDRPADEVVVLFLAARALPTPSGKGVSLLLADSRLDEPNRWLPLDEVFSRLRACPARHKFLLLDVAQPFASARDGLLSDDIATRLDPLLTAAVEADPALRILSACSAGQVSLASPEVGHTLFAWHVLRGLQGRAERKPDGRITFEELADYVRTEVDRCAWHQFGLRQTPQLFGQGKDFALALVESDDAEPAPLPRNYPGWLLDGWKQRDAWWKDESFRLFLPQFSNLELRLLRAERDWRGGADGERVRSELAGFLEALAQERLSGVRNQEAGGRGQERHSLAAAARNAKPLDPPAEVVRGKLAKLAELDALVRQNAKPPEAEKERRDREVAAFLKPYDGKPLELARALFEAALAEPEPSRSLILLIAALLPEEPAGTYVETQWLRQLATLPVDAARPWPARAVAQALRAVKRSEQAALADPRTATWAADRIQESARHLERGRKFLFSAQLDEWPAAEETLREAAQGYAKANRILDIVRRARFLLDSTLARLPSYAVYLETSGADEDAGRAWESVCAAVGRLQRLLATFPPVSPGGKEEGSRRDGVVQELEATVGRLNSVNSLQQLSLPAEEASLRVLIDRSEKGKPADARTMRALLDLAWLRADQRLRLWSAYRRLAGRLDAEWREQAADAPSLAAWSEADIRRARRAARDHALWRARVSLSLLRLQGRGGEPLQTIYDRTRASLDADLQPLATELRRRWR